MDDHPDTASPREDNRLPGAGRVRRSDQERVGDAATARHVPPAAHRAACGQAHVRQLGCRAIRRGHHRGDHWQCQVRRPREESGLYRGAVARHGNPGITCQGSWRSSPAGLAARGSRRGRCDGTRQAAAPWLAQHTQPDQRSQLLTTNGWPARILLATTRPGYARHSAQPSPPRHGARPIAQSHHHEEETQMIQPYPDSAQMRSTDLTSSPPAAQKRQTQMTATRQQRHSLSRWPITALSRAIRTLRHLNEELLGAGEAIARSARAPQPRPQPDAAEAKPAHPASAGKLTTGV
jgi:hypothetical protein